MFPARRPYPDELASSAIYRCSRQFNIPVKRLGRVVLGRDGWRPSFLGASPLHELAQLFRLSPEDLLWNHTTFPYATARMQHQYYESALANALGGARQMVGFGAVTQNVTAGLAYRKFCDLCVDEERERHLESFWHRSHNLPGVWLCTRHGTFLQQTSLPVSSSGHMDKALPHECTGRRLGTGNPSAGLRRVADTSVKWLQRQRGPSDPMSPSTYRQTARDNGWLSRDRPVSVHALADCLIKSFGRRFLGEAGVFPDDARWANLMLRPTIDLPFMPVKHAILHSLLSHRRPPELQRFDHISAGPSKSAADLLDRFYARAAETRLRLVVGQGSELTTEQFLRAAGCWGSYKHRKHELPKLRAVVRQFRGSTATVKRLREGKTLFRHLHNE